MFNCFNKILNFSILSTLLNAESVKDTSLYSISVTDRKVGRFYLKNILKKTLKTIRSVLFQSNEKGINIQSPYIMECF